MTKDILIIADNTISFHGICNRLASEDINIHYVEFLEEALWKMQIHSFCLTILDVSLSDETVIESISAIRKASSMPILVLSEDTDIKKRVKALQSGADDFLQKPYDLGECVVRIQALLRRYTELNYVKESHYVIASHDGLFLDTGRRILSVNGKEIELTPKEYGILELLIKNRRQIMTYEQICETVWKDVYLGDADKEVVFYQIGQLRRKIGKERIESVLLLYYFVGYRDEVIGRLYGRCRSSINRRRNVALKQLRKEWERLEHEEREAVTF